MDINENENKLNNQEKSGRFDVEHTEAEEQWGVISALTSHYANVYTANFKTGEVKVYRYLSQVQGDVKAKALSGTKYEDLIKVYVENNVVEEDHKMFYEMASTENIISTLKLHHSFVMHYRVNRNDVLHYFYMRCIRIGNASDFDTVVLGFASEDADKMKLYAPSSAVSENSKRRSVLIVDDDEISRCLLKEMLKDRYDILEAADGVTGLEILKREYRYISAVLLDMMMPGLNGLEVLDRIADDGLLATVPIIFMTGEQDEAYEEKSLMLGAVDFIRKPFKLGIVRKRVEAVISARESKALLNAIEYDKLTGVYTRRAFFHHAEMMVQAHPDRRYDLMISDIEDFKVINERYGNRVGDELLVHIADCFRSIANPDVVIGRFSGDRFAVLFPYENVEKVEQVFKPYVDSLYKFKPVKDFVMKYGTYSDVDVNDKMLVICDRAMSALRTIKHQYGKKFADFNQRMRNKLEHNRLIEEYMEQALIERQFFIYYQPKHNAKTGELEGAEALVRWIHPELGFISPADFIPLFERNGFISKLDEYVWNSVCEDMSRWVEMGYKVVPVSVNASRCDFTAVEGVRRFTDATDKYGIDRNLLHVEVTESLYMDDEEGIIPLVKNVRDEGFKIEMDDFGSGYSSLGLIGELPIDIIKMDMSFVRHFEENKEVIKVIMYLADALGKKTVAEGVENQEQLDFLKEVGCEYIQGYYFSKPLPKAAFEKYMDSYDEELK